MNKFNTKVKIATFIGDINKPIKKYSKNFGKTIVGRTDVEKYITMIEKDGAVYQIAISQASAITHLYGDSWNIIVTVLSTAQNCKKGIESIMDDFEKNMPFNLREAPNEIKRLFPGGC